MQPPPVDPASTALHQALSVPSRRRIVEHLRVSATPLSAAEIGEALSLHVTTVRAHLARLLGAGLVVRYPRTPTRPGRPVILYELSAAGLQPVPGGAYRLLAEILVDDLDRDPEAEAKAIEIGTRWGSRLMRRAAGTHPPDSDAVGQLTSMFDQLGFSPQRADHDVRLHTCPFGDLATDHERVVCSLHLGMAQGALETLDADPAELTLRPFVEPDLCVLALVARDR